MIRRPFSPRPFFYRFLLTALLFGSMAVLHAQELGKPANSASSATQAGGVTVREVSVVKPLVVPLEQCADRLTEKGKDYATCKLVRLDPAALQKVNTIAVSFPDGKPGAVGAVVIRTAYQVP